MSTDRTRPFRNNGGSVQIGSTIDSEKIGADRKIVGKFQIRKSYVRNRYVPSLTLPAAALACQPVDHFQNQMVWVIQFIIKLIMGCSWQNDLKIVCLAKSLRSTLFDMNRAEISDEHFHAWPSSCHGKKTVLQNALCSTLFDHDWAATSKKVFWHEFSIAKCSAFRVIWQCRLGWNQSSQMLLNALFNEQVGWIVHYSTPEIDRNQ